MEKEAKENVFARDMNPDALVELLMYIIPPPPPLCPASSSFQMKMMI